jgi:hypothetical protein
MVTNLVVNGVSEKEIKTIMETTNPLCDGKKGQFRSQARKVFEVVFASRVTDPKKNHVMQALKAAKKCELFLNGNKIQKEKLKMTTHDAVKDGKIEVETAEWEPTTSTLKLSAVTM